MKALIKAKVEQWRKSADGPLAYLEKRRKAGWWGIDAHKRFDAKIPRCRGDLDTLKRLFGKELQKSDVRSLIKNGLEALRQAEELAICLQSLPFNNPGLKRQTGEIFKPDEETRLKAPATKAKLIDRDKIRIALANMNRS